MGIYFICEKQLSEVVEITIKRFFTEKQPVI